MEDEAEEEEEEESAAEAAAESATGGAAEGGLPLRGCFFACFISVCVEEPTAYCLVQPRALHLRWRMMLSLLGSLMSVKKAYAGEEVILSTRVTNEDSTHRCGHSGVD